MGLKNIVLIHEHGMSFHLFVYFKISFISVYNFQCKSLTSLVKLAPKYFILFAANDIVFLISLTVGC